MGCTIAVEVCRNRQDTLIVEAGNPIMEIDDADIREKIQLSNLDYHTILPFLDDHQVMLAILEKAGIESPGDQLKTITMLKAVRNSNIRPQAAAEGESRQSLRDEGLAMSKFDCETLLPGVP